MLKANFNFYILGPKLDYALLDAFWLAELEKVNFRESRSIFK